MSDRDLSLRLAEPGDRDLLFEWANDPVTRANAFASDPISPETHDAWFAAMLANPDRLQYIVLYAGKPVGQVRFDVVGERVADISISIAPEWRGRGLATPTIRLATTQAAPSGIETVHAYLKPDNEVSRRAFGRAGYAEGGRVDVSGAPALRMTAPAAEPQFD